jgi:hypothetical protein
MTLNAFQKYNTMKKELITEINSFGAEKMYAKFQVTVIVPFYHTT